MPTFVDLPSIDSRRFTGAGLRLHSAAEQHSNDAFPTKEVYGETRNPSLRLITCGGEFDHSSGHYVDNVIVFAHLEQR